MQIRLKSFLPVVLQNQIHTIAGFGEASLHIDKSVAHAERLQKLKSQMIVEIKRFKNDCVVNSPEKNCLSNTINLRFPGVKNENILAMLNYYGIEVSAGSACSSGDEKPSYVLNAIGLSDDAARETIRISMGGYTKRQDVRYMIETLKEFFEGKALFVPSITTPELKALISSDSGIVVLDIRPEFQRKKLPGDSRFKTILDRDIEKNLDQIPIDQHVVIACETGQLSILTAYSLKSKGYSHVSSLKDGIRGWYDK